VAQSRRKNGVRQLDWETVSYVTSVDGDVLIVERSTSSTSEATRFTVLLDRGRGLDLLQDYLNTLYHTSSGIPELRTRLSKASPRGKSPTRLA
jgi:hypothetical protein